jgi:hypothetical protein
VITGRGPGAPGVTLGADFTRRRATTGGTGGRAVDLGEIRRSEDAINVLAARGAAGLELTRDPALMLLGSLVADVDTPGTVTEPGVPGLAGAPSRGAGVWLRAAVTGGVVAGLASVTSLIATSMLARLTRGSSRAGRWQPRHVRPHRCADRPAAGHPRAGRL